MVGFAVRSNLNYLPTVSQKFLRVEKFVLPLIVWQYVYVEQPNILCLCCLLLYK
jgi:hypothetical protein